LPWAVAYLIYKLLFWNEFALGVAPMLLGLVFFRIGAIVFSRIVGEYVGAMHTQILARPLVIEKERVNSTRRRRQGKCSFPVCSGGTGQGLRKWLGERPCGRPRDGRHLKSDKILKRYAHIGKTRNGQG